MKKILFFCFIQSFFGFSQNLVTYSTTYPTMMIQNNPSLVPNITDTITNVADYKVGFNTDFTVNVRRNLTGETYTTLQSYNTFVNNSVVGWDNGARSSFVTFDYNGVVVVEITCNNYQTLTASQVVIRPLSKQIVPSVNGNKIKFILSSPLNTAESDKLSVEIKNNGVIDRYHNLQIFANRYVTEESPTAGGYNKIYLAANNNTNTNKYLLSENTPINPPRKIFIEKGAIVQVEVASGYTNENGKIRLFNNEEIYIQGGGILNGGILADNASNIKIRGRGIVDISNYPKNYSQFPPQSSQAMNAVTLRNCKNIEVDGIIVNDPQQMCFEVTDCGGESTDEVNNMKFNNVKVFSRAIWGDGFHMRGTSNVVINDCFNRTSDDCISIYTSRHQTWDTCPETPETYPDTGHDSPANPTAIPCATTGGTPYKNRNAQNIKVTNTALYADETHAIEIGWHGNQMMNGLTIYNLWFENIDILEHNVNAAAHPNPGFVEPYEGAIGITCGDDNKCIGFLFKNINIEDFTAGSLMAVRVLPYGTGDAKTSGRQVSDIRFENLTYTGSGEKKSLIQGYNSGKCDRFVNGVHFQNFKYQRNGSSVVKLVESPADYFDETPSHQSLFDINSAAYNITFEEANKYSDQLTAGNYYIKNGTKYLKRTSTNNLSATYTVPTSDDIWTVTYNAGHYRIRAYNVSNATTLTNDFAGMIPTFNCQARYVKALANAPANTNQEWKINPVTGSGSYTLNDAYTKAFLTNDLVNGDILALPKIISDSSQKWVFQPYTGPNRPGNNNNAMTNQTGTIDVYPNPVESYLSINNLERKEYNIELFDLSGRMVKRINEVLCGNVQVYLGDVQKGLYILKITSNGEEFYAERLLKAD